MFYEKLIITVWMNFMSNKDGLRTQIIDAMSKYPMSPVMAEDIFDQMVWPVLEKAVEAGKLVVWRNTVPQKPVDESIKIWLRACLGKITLIQDDEKIISKAQLLKTLYQLAVSAEHALAEAEAIEKGIPY